VSRPISIKTSTGAPTLPCFRIDSTARTTLGYRGSSRYVPTVTIPGPRAVRRCFAVARSTVVERPPDSMRAGERRDSSTREPELLGGREPPALVARGRCDEVCEDLLGTLLRVLPGNGAEGGEIRPRPVRPKPVARVRVVDEAGGEEHLLAERVDVAVARPGPARALGEPDRLGPLVQDTEGLHRPALVGPEGLGLQHVDELAVALCAVEGGKARGRAVEVAPQALVGTQRHPGNAEKLVDA